MQGTHHFLRKVVDRSALQHLSKCYGRRPLDRIRQERLKTRSWFHKPSSPVEQARNGSHVLWRAPLDRFVSRRANPDPRIGRTGCGGVAECGEVEPRNVMLARHALRGTLVDLD